MESGATPVGCEADLALTAANHPPCCPNRRCLICRADWAELARRMNGLHELEKLDVLIPSRAMGRELQCEGLGCPRTFLQTRPTHRFCSRRCQKKNEKQKNDKARRDLRDR